MSERGTARWIAVGMAVALGLLLTLPAFGQSAWDAEAGARLESGNATLPAAGARLEPVARRGRHHGKAKAAPAISRAQMELAREMVADSYAMGRRLELRQRVALMMRLLYTMRPEVMAEEKRQWAEELFRLGQELPASGAGADAGSGNAALPAAGARAGNASLPAAGAQAIATAAGR